MSNRPHTAEGAALKKARGGRKLREVAEALGVTISRLQNWERGDNAPKRDLWPKFHAVLGIDVSALYGGSEAPTAPQIKPKAILPLILEIRRKLDLLEAMCAEAVPSETVKKAGFSAKAKREKEKV